MSRINMEAAERKFDTNICISTVILKIRKLCFRVNGDTICDKTPKDHIKYNVTLNLVNTQEREEKCLIFYCYKYSINI
jgi:hypothetical protein